MKTMFGKKNRTPEERNKQVADFNETFGELNDSMVVLLEAHMKNAEKTPEVVRAAIQRLAKAHAMFLLCLL